MRTQTAKRLILMTLIGAAIFYLRFSAQKSRVKFHNPPNPLLRNNIRVAR
jgi:hypothetical protein